MKLLKIIFIAAILVLPFSASAQTDQTERILDFHSDIEVHQDSSMTVAETIKVVSTQDQILHGIYRDFPIAYKDKLGNRYLVSFELLSVTRDSNPEPYHIQKAGNGLRIYAGDANTIIPEGIHEYVFTYKTGRQLGFSADHDELYWNVTGNGWVFPIDSASATVNLPGNIPKEKITTALYTGKQGSTASNGTSNIADSTAEFSAADLGSKEGLTIVVSWPKGFVLAPSALQQFLWSIQANLDYVIGILGFLLVFAFYFYRWYKSGRDPKKGTIIAQYESPRGLSPAFLRFIKKMGSDNRSFAAAIIDMGVKDALTVTENKSGFLNKTDYTLAKKGEGKNLSEEEGLLQNRLFKDKDTVTLSATYDSSIRLAQTEFESSLKKQAGKQYFTKNISAVVLGVLFSLAIFAATIIAAISIRYGVQSPLQVLFWPCLIVAFLVLNITFGILMRAYTVEGRELADEIEGFKLFLNVTEKDRLTFHNPPEKTPELFEKMLPYALALGVEHQWAQQFADIFARMEQQGRTYSPIWYHGAFTHFSPDGFATAVGSSFTGVVSSASTIPRSRSGGGGGGFSGGGGGGGGGGGW